MALFSPSDRRFAQAVSQLVYCNPFLPERIACERAALGEAFDEAQPAWNIAHANADDHPNVQALIRRADQVLESAAKRLRSGGAAGSGAGDPELVLYEDLVVFSLYHRYREAFDRTIAEGLGGKRGGRVMTVYETFMEQAGQYLEMPGVRDDAIDELPHAFACFFQVRRAFHNIFHYIVGQSRPAVRLRAAVWESIFTHDMRRYRRALFSRMADFTTLITGPSGTGKELVARAVGLSRYIPFDTHKERFTEDFAGTFFPLSLSAMSPTLIESELFGHRRGSFTGAIGDRVGWLEACPPLGTVFLDEIGELEGTIQVKLLRVLQSREFSRLGETDVRQFRGKIIAATNRDPAVMVGEGRFREDLYYRLCSDQIVTPSLRERLADDPAELERLVSFMARRIVGEGAEEVVREVVGYVEREIGGEYSWPGNVRELEQCVRNVVMRRAYRPLEQRGGAADEAAELAQAMRRCEMTADEVLARYCALAYRRYGTYEGTAKRIGLDRRTVKAKVESITGDGQPARQSE